ncbi:Protein of unknown function [Pseudomonas sp. NFACC23-1]|uniref:DUF1302 domain-containing protein n=1 Tax=unclassified Pseudomonas TaxID=196821 RepID=UPI00087F557B|nr:MULTISPECIES: DUF1302 family protein [unclassified Pseudomonas]SDB50765.1 Protein of unknown function [Pseudomonas sp. NFACC17-2]SEI92582.1 Protein of unknown function [Pseudomonas sp. NFACC23-1]SFW85100.1 Protein of unknown function [Pseudomonas sp. NFACC16-2]
MKSEAGVVRASAAVLNPAVPFCKKAALGIAVAAGLGIGCAQADQFKIGEEIDATWSNTIKYSLGSRLSSPNDHNLANANTDDADRNFDRGSIMMNRFDFLSEFNARYQNFGLSLSAAAWYDQAYMSHNDNDSPGTFNPYSVDHDEFTSETKQWAGRNIEVMNAFVSGQFTPGDIPVSVRLGQHTLLWGESLFFTDNGIAAAMAPVDAYKALTVPNTKAQELFLPTKQISGSMLLGNAWTIEGFYQFEWDKTRIPPVGSYMSSVDILDQGGERIIAAPGTYLYHGKDEHPDAGQFGLSARWRPEDLNLDLGFYAIRYNDKTPQVVTELSGGFDPQSGSIGSYHLRYQEKIELYGMSANMTFGQLNVGAEMSYRHGVALRAASNVLDPDVTGDTLHAQLSAIYVGSAGPLWDNVSLAGELAGHKLMRTLRNGDQRDQSLDDIAYGMRGVATFDYYQVTPGLDLQVPIGLGYNFKGESPVAAAFNNYGSNQGGDVSVGIVGIYQQDWKIGLNATHFFGSEGDNYYTGRDFVMASVTRTF